MASSRHYTSLGFDSDDSLRLSDIEDQLETDLKVMEKKSSTSKRRHPPPKEANYRHDQAGKHLKLTGTPSQGSRRRKSLQRPAAGTI